MLRKLPTPRKVPSSGGGSSTHNVSRNGSSSSTDWSLTRPLLTLDTIADVLLLSVVCLFVNCGLEKLLQVSFPMLGVSLWLVCTLIYLGLRSRKVAVTGKAVVITGCDTGIGHQLALHLHRGGLRVFALCLDADGEGARALKGRDKLHVIPCDVTSMHKLKEARDQILSLLPRNEVLWGLVNNAGVATFGDLEWVPMDTFRRVLEVNLVGVAAASQVFLPLVRRAKGRIVNITSLLGRFAVPMRFPYVASKYAAEGLSDCMRYELRDWGVAVCIIEPGNYIAGTNIFTSQGVDSAARQMWEAMPAEVQQLYGEDLFWRKVQVMKDYAHAGDTDLTPVLQAFASALIDKWPRVRYQPANLRFKTQCVVATHLPEWVYEAIYIRVPK